MSLCKKETNATGSSATRCATWGSSLSPWKDSRCGWPSYGPCCSEPWFVTRVPQKQNHTRETTSCQEEFFQKVHETARISNVTSSCQWPPLNAAAAFRILF